MVKKFWIFVCFALLGCSEGVPFEEFLHENGKEKEVFLIDSEGCEKEKDKFSNKIQGREFGFEGKDTGYLGCMKLKGWSRKVL